MAKKQKSYEVSRGPYETLVDAATMLTSTRYTEGFASPGRPRLWVNLDDHSFRKAIGCNADDGLFYIVDYPEPATATPSEVERLAEEQKLREAGILI